MALTVKQIEHALKQTAGNISASARELRVARNTLYARINSSERLQQVLTDAREELVDIAESALRRELLDGNITAIIFTLKTRGRERGYIERKELEHTGQGGGAITFKVVYDDDLSD